MLTRPQGTRPRWDTARLTRPTGRGLTSLTAWSSKIIIVTIWNVVFANKSRKLGWIWMKLGRWGWGQKRLSLARFQRNRAMGFGESANNGSQRRFCQVNDTPLLPLSLNRFPPNFPRTRVHVLARDTWFHIPEKFPLWGRISRKTVFLGSKRVPCLCPAYGSRLTFFDA